MSSDDDAEYPSYSIDALAELLESAGPGDAIEVRLEGDRQEILERLAALDRRKADLIVRIDGVTAGTPIGVIGDLAVEADAPVQFDHRGHVLQVRVLAS